MYQHDRVDEGGDGGEGGEGGCQLRPPVSECLSECTGVQPSTVAQPPTTLDKHSQSGHSSEVLKERFI